MRILVTGGAGFIGSAVIREIIQNTPHQVLNIDCLTYAGNLENLTSVSNSTRYTFSQVDICDVASLQKAFDDFSPQIIMHLAAESHVDRSIDDPSAFIKTNVFGTCNLLNCALNLFKKLSAEEQALFRFHHISTDEVFGSLGENGLFTEDTPYAPTSPYSASKASSDHFVRAWHHTYGLPTIVTNCSNNYGPYHFPEKLIPLVILNALEGKPLPVYGDGSQIRDWLFVEDHASALLTAVQRGKPGSTYNIGGHNEIKNIDVVKQICAILDKKVTAKPENLDCFADLITFVRDRPGHDVRYAIDAARIQNELDWQPKESFATGLEKTIDWYLDNTEWCDNITSGKYKRDRLGTLK